METKVKRYAIELRVSIFEVSRENAIELAEEMKDAFYDEYDGASFFSGCNV